MWLLVRILQAEFFCSLIPRITIHIIENEGIINLFSQGIFRIAQSVFLLKYLNRIHFSKYISA